MYGIGFIKGLAVTITNWARGPMTIQYPEERLVLHERTRWALASKFDEDGAPKCTACMACVRECPDFILHLESSAKPEGGKHIDSFVYEMGACMMCGLCVEACPFDAIHMSHEYELATSDHDELVRVLLKDLDAASTRKAKTTEPGDAAKPAESAGAADAKEAKDD